MSLWTKQFSTLASSSSKKSIGCLSKFYNPVMIEITAQYFNKNYEFDDSARLTIIITNIETKTKKL
jgi:hypothetical protein